MFYSVRSERMRMERMRYNQLFRWFAGATMDDAVRDHSMLSKSRDRLVEHDVVEAFLMEVMAMEVMTTADCQPARLLSNEHFFRQWHADPGVDLP